MELKRRLFSSPLLALLGFLSILALPAASADTTAWSVAVLDHLLASAPAGGPVTVGDMRIPVSYLQGWRNHLAGGPQPKLAFSGTFTKWSAGDVYYAFSNNVSAGKQQAFLDGMAEWAMFANLHFIPYTNEPNYVFIYEAAEAEGGQSDVGMIGGEQYIQIGPTSWNRPTICHELGHTLGLVHEHQRFDRDNFVTIFTNNVASGDEGDFILLTDSQNETLYDFLSVMHYSRTNLSVSPLLDVIEPLPPYSQYLNLMGQLSDPVLSAYDRAGMAAVYGPGPVITNLVTNTRDSGPGSLRAALYYAFDHPGATITFNLPVTDPGFSNNVFNILPTYAEPGLWNNTTLDAGTQPTHTNPNGPQVLLNGALAWPLDTFPSGLRFRSTNSVARAFVINNFPESGVLFDGSNTVGNTVSGCYLGTDPTGTLAVTNGICPVQISGGAVSNLVGGTTAAARNVIGGGIFQGLAIRDPGTHGNVVQGNYIGLNAAGNAPLPNGFAGIEIFGGAQSNLIGGATAGARNIISGNALQGVLISDPGTTGNVVAGNYLGLNPAGTAPLPNGYAGAEIGGGAQANLIGGPASGAGNVISGNTLQGVLIDGTGTSDNWVEGNYLGLNPAGTTAVSNDWAGVDISSGATANHVGGDLPGDGNVISGNGNQGVLIQYAGTVGNFVQGNLIGLNAAGNAAVPNTWSGVEIFDGAAANLVGGYGGARNVISGNGNYGVFVDFNNNGNTIQGNTIGLDAANDTVIPNGAAAGYAAVGLYVACSNLVGGVAIGDANVIAGSVYVGVQVAYFAPNNTIRGNSIFGNAGGAIAIYSGGNNGLAAPVLAAAAVFTNTVVSGTYTGATGTPYLLDFYSDAPPVATAEAATYLGSISVPGTGGASAFHVVLGAHLPAGRIVSATATDPAGNTSQLSPGVAVDITSSVNDGIPDAWRAAYFGGSGTTTNSQSDAFADPDHTGLDNYQKFLAGLNPTNPASVFKLSAHDPTTATNAVSLETASGTVYRISVCDDLLVADWAILADQVIGAGTNLFFADPAAPLSPKRFYRAQVLW
jgi:hypothetical protein